MMRLLVVLSLVFLVTLSSSFAAFGEVIEFSEFKRDVTYDDGVLYVKTTALLKNTAPYPIIPGELHFTLFERSGFETHSVPVSDFTVVGLNNKNLETYIDTGSFDSDLYFLVWEPVLPGFSYPLTITYTIDFKPKGLLFYNIELPIEETTIPIRKKTLTFSLDSSYFVTYATQGAAVTKLPDQKVVSISDTHTIRVEFTHLPLPKLPVMMVHVFWMILLIILAGILTYRYRSYIRAAYEKMKHVHTVKQSRKRSKSE